MKEDCLTCEHLRTDKDILRCEVFYNAIIDEPKEKQCEDSIYPGYERPNKADDYNIECVAMAIVNYTNEINKADLEIRQANNDKCFDYAIEKIREMAKT